MTEQRTPDRPVLLVDVDGTLTGRPDDIRAQLGPDGALSFRVLGRRVSIRRDLPLLLGRLEERFDCVWATDWQDQAPLQLSPFIGAGASWAWVRFGMHGVAGMGSTWKLPAVARWAEENAAGRPVAWVDDDLQRDAEEWAIERSRIAAPTLLVRARTGGLIHGEVDSLLEWAGVVARSASAPEGHHRAPMDPGGSDREGPP